MKYVMNETVHAAKRISRRVLTRLGFTIASTIALHHANTPVVVPCSF